MKLGIVGQGFVGTAVKEVMSNYYTVNTFDIKQKCTCDSLYELVNTSDVVFVCVPTPMNEDGSCYTGIVEGVVEDINDRVEDNSKIVVI